MCKSCKTTRKLKQKKVTENTLTTSFTIKTGKFVSTLLLLVLGFRYFESEFL